MKLLLATTAMSLLMAAGVAAPASAETETLPADAPVWMASVISLADDGGLSLVQDDEDDCEDEEDDEDEDEDEDEEDEEEDEDEDEDEEDDEDDEDEEDDECDADEDELA